MQQEVPPFWRFPPYSALLADPFIENTDLEEGDISLTFQVLEVVLKKILNQWQSEGSRSVGLDLFNESQVNQLEFLLKLMHDCAETSKITAKAEKPEDFLKVIQIWVEKIENIPEGGLLLVPAGWEGLLNRGNLVYIILRNSSNDYSLLLCNTGMVIIIQTIFSFFFCLLKLKLKLLGIGISSINWM